MMKQLIIILAAALLPCYCFGQDLSSYDGTAWRDEGRSSRVMLVTGLLYGVNAGLDQAAGAAPENAKTSSSNDRSAARSKLASYYLRNVTAEQMTDGLDALYADYTNRSIKLMDAVYVVKKQLEGIPSGDIEKILSYLRDDKTNPAALIVRDEKGNVVRTITFP